MFQCFAKAAFLSPWATPGDEVKAQAVAPAIGSEFMNAQPDIRLLLSDVDGALLPKDKVLTETTKEVVRELRRAVTDSNENEGFGKAVRKFILRQVIA
jgi:hypothetical protein